jgi:hypothetical protein
MSGRIILLLLGMLLLSACDNGPYVGVGLGFGPGGVSVSPSVSGRVGDVNVGASL